MAIPTWHYDERLTLERGISFEKMVVAIEGELAGHSCPSEPEQVRNQKVLVVARDRYAYLMPFFEEEDHFFLKTDIPSRKATRDYLKQGEDGA